MLCRTIVADDADSTDKASVVVHFPASHGRLVMPEIFRFYGSSDSDLAHRWAEPQAAKTKLHISICVHLRSSADQTLPFRFDAPLRP